MPSASGQSTLNQAWQSWLQDALHDLSQPLTTLQCRLLLSTLHDPGSDQERTEMRQAIEEGLRQCERMIVGVRRMQQHIDGN